jgi:hypothetical protein
LDNWQRCRLSEFFRYSSAGLNECFLASHSAPLVGATVLIISKVFERCAYEDGVMLDFSSPGQPIGNAVVESLNGRLCDECLDMHLLSSPVGPRDNIQV